MKLMLSWPTFRIQLDTVNMEAHSGKIVSKMHILRILCILVCPLLASSSPETMSIIINPADNSVKDYITIINPPKILRHNDAITVAYRCQGDGQLGLDIRIWTDQQEDHMSFRHTWTCHGLAVSELRKTVIVKFSNKLAYRPSRRNPYTVFVDEATIFTWILDKGVWEKRLNTMFQFALARSTETVEILPPYERPEKPLMVCYSWWKELQMSKPYTPKCSDQIQVFRGVTYPIALSGTSHGKHTVIPQYKHKQLQNQQKQLILNPRFTVVLWLYVLEFCPAQGRSLCSIMQRITWDDYYRTPNIFFNKQGKLHVQAQTEEVTTHVTEAFLSAFPVPKEQWCRIIISFENRRYDVYLTCEDNRDHTWHTYYIIRAGFPIHYDDTQGLHIFGGSEVLPSFKGYIGEATIYRGKVIKPSQLIFPSPYHPMFELGVKSMRSKCETFLTWVVYRQYTASVLMEYIKEKNSCSNKFEDIFHLTLVSQEPQCAIFREPKSEERVLVSRLVRKLVTQNKQVELTDIGTQIYERAVLLIEEEGFDSVKSVVQLLKQASCYGNHDATFMLSAILNNGVGVKANEAMSHMYLMHGAIDNNRLCLLALGNKHHYGYDGLAQDYEQAYVYYKNVADRTKHDRDSHHEEDIMTEMVRLTDEDMMNEQTDEEGDLFNWFKHQAANGVLSAQQNMARLLFWGSQGVKRNLQAAVEYYRMGAESNDPVALHDLGIVLLKGQGTEKNETEAKAHLTKAADMGNSGAMNALGWHALEIERNYTLAMAYFQRSYELGNVDAGHNLGHMWISGLTKESKPDRVKAFHYFEWAAVHGQMDSALMVALYNMRGHASIRRSTLLGDEWARYVSEKNPAVGKILSLAVKAYRKHNWPASLLYYLIASETGVEVANFNLAYLCEENQDGVVHYMEKECVWRHFNMTLQRHPNDISAYALIKMGDYHWYACEGHKDSAKAAELYSDAAVKGDPHAIFNLAFMVEEGVNIDEKTWRKLRIPRSVHQNNVTLLSTLYDKCQESRNSEAFFPCMMAKYRVQFLDVWERYNILLKLSTFAGALLTFLVTATSIYHYFRGNNPNIDSV